MPKLMKRPNCLVRTDGRTDPIYRKTGSGALRFQKALNKLKNISVFMRPYETETYKYLSYFTT